MLLFLLESGLIALDFKVLERNVGELTACDCTISWLSVVIGKSEVCLMTWIECLKLVRIQTIRTALNILAILFLKLQTWWEKLRMSWANSLPDCFALICFLNSTEVTATEELIKMQFFFCFNVWMVFQKAQFANAVWMGVNLPLS